MAIEVIEAKLVSPIGGIFNPVAISVMSADLVTSIAGESEENRAQCEQLIKQLEVLMKGSDICKRFVGIGLLKYLIRKLYAQNVAYDSTPEFWLINGDLNHYALRIENCQWREVVDWNDIDSNDIFHIGYLDNMMGRLKEAEAMHVRALKGKENAWGAEHTSTLDTVNNLRNLYAVQGKMAKAEKMYVWALKGFEKIYDANHPRVLNVICNLSLLKSVRK
ncbi:MAG: hypothetical protein M1812_007878 [Candelaria pacifica]|nr:MAG: hypothetical protein M1812_007878 [Candelaria pacifica]